MHALAGKPIRLLRVKERPIIREIQAGGVSSMCGIARALTARGVKTARRGDWSDVQVAASSLSPHYRRKPFSHPLPDDWIRRNLQQVEQA